jgi:protein-tyrosine kinase
MDKIRQALDRVREERAESYKKHVPDKTSRLDSVSPGEKQAVAASIGSFVYTETRVFTPPAPLLENNRILDPRSAEAPAAAFRLLRTQVLQRMDTQGWRSLAIFSSSAHEGKTTVAINLAVSIAGDQRHSVLLVDFDFKHPSVAVRLGLAPEFGADDTLLGNARIEDCLYHPSGFDRLVIFPARTVLSNSSEVLSGPRCREVVADLRSRYPERILLFDLPPVLNADDALAFAPLIECGLVVVMEGVTRREDLVRAIELLHRTPLVGTVLNNALDVSSGY